MVPERHTGAPRARPRDHGGGAASWEHRQLGAVSAAPAATAPAPASTTSTTTAPVTTTATGAAAATTVAGTVVLGSGELCTLRLLWGGALRLGEPLLQEAL